MSLSLHNTLKKLEAYNNSSFPILSVYFHPQEDKKTFEEQLIEFINNQLNAKQRQQVEQNISYMQGFIEKYQPKYTNESLVIFSGDNIIFEIIHLPYIINNQINISHSPFLKPLLTQQTAYRRYLVILVDREKAKFFTLSQGAIESLNEVYDPSVPQNVHPDTSEALYVNRERKINRHIQDHLNRHFALICKKIEEFAANKPIHGVIIGGHKLLFNQFKKQLPAQLKNKIVGEFTSELNININDIVKKSNIVIAKVDEDFNNERYPY